MSYIQITEMPPNAMVWQRHITDEEDMKGLVVPPGFETVLYHEGNYLGPFREGDSLTLPATKGWLRRRSAVNARLYVCRRSLPKPLYWGMGGLPASEGVTFGASGQMRLSLSNAQAIVRSLAAAQEALENDQLTRQLESLVVGVIRPSLITAVKGMGLENAKHGLEPLAEKVMEALDLELRGMGLQADSLLVENIVVSGGAL